MANKTTVPATVKHAMLDIEIGIDADLQTKIQSIKDVYAEDIRVFKEAKNEDIKVIKASKHVLMSEALGDLMTEEEA